MVVTVKNKYTKLSSTYFNIKLYVDENCLLYDCVGKFSYLLKVP